MNILGRLNKEGHTIILVTHDRTVAEHAHRIITIKDGLLHLMKNSNPRKSEMIEDET